jgi:hypothetical protein
MGNAKDHILKARERAKTHLEKPRTEAGALAVGVCGALGGSMVDDLVAFKGLPDDRRCKRCEAALARAGQAARKRARSSDKRMTSAELGSDLLEAAGVSRRKGTRGRASIDPPPQIDAELWRRSCKGAVDPDEKRGVARCKGCWMCERDAKIDAVQRDEDTYTRPHGVGRPAGSRTWKSLGDFFTAMSRPGRPLESSAQGAMLDKARLGLLGKQPQASRPDDPHIDGASDDVLWRRLMAHSYPQPACLECGAAFANRAASERADESGCPRCGSAEIEVCGHPTMSAPDCRSALWDRYTNPEFSYEATAERLGVDPGDVRAAVRHGEWEVTIELAAAELIPDPPPPRGMATDRWLDMLNEIERRKAELARQRDRLQRQSAERARAPSHGARGLVANG